MQKCVYDYSKLLGRMRECKVTQRALASQLGLSETTLNWALSNKRQWRQDEIIDVCGILNLPVADVDKYFFSLKTCDLQS